MKLLASLIALALTSCAPCDQRTRAADLGRQDPSRGELSSSGCLHRDDVPNLSRKDDAGGLVGPSWVEHSRLAELLWAEIGREPRRDLLGGAEPGPQRIRDCAGRSRLSRVLDLAASGGQRAQGLADLQVPSPSSL